MAKDIIHFSVVAALKRDGWTVTDEPFVLQTGNISVDIDLAAEKFLQAERGMERIFVEVKSFGNRSLVYDFHAALGQYLDYRGGLNDEGFDQPLFLAVTEETFLNFQRAEFFMRRIAEFDLKLLVVNTLSESIVQWIK